MLEGDNVNDNCLRGPPPSAESDKRRADFSDVAVHEPAGDSGRQPGKRSAEKPEERSAKRTHTEPPDQRSTPVQAQQIQELEVV